jgi:hypothetical protein
VSCAASRGCVWDEVQRISDPCVFGFRLVVEVDASRRGVERDIFEDSAETLCGRMNFGLELRR